MTRLTTDDWVTISDILGRYCWLVDEDSTGEEWASLWEPDGVFVGIKPEPVVGRAQLKNVPIDSIKDYKGGCRHVIGNLHAVYGDNRDIVKARFYNYVSQWGEVLSGNFVMAICEATLVRHGDSWLIRRNEARLLLP
jgi:hypothetical protein